MISRNTIVVGIDTRAPSLRAAEWAAAEAAVRGAALTLVHAVVAPVSGPPAIPTITPTISDIAREEARLLLAATRSSLQAEYPSLTIRSRLMDGSAARVLRRVGAEAMMTVVGCRLGHHPVTDGLIGSVAAALAEHSIRPVVVVRPPDGRVPVTGPVMVGVDGSPLSQAALAFAFEEASLRGADLIAVHTWTVDAPAGSGQFRDFTVDTVTERECEHRLLAEQLAGWDQKYPDVRVDRDVRRGPPGEALWQASQTHLPALLVVGSRGRNGMASILLGSTSRELLATSPCPVAVVRDRR